MGLGIDYWWPLISLKERQLNIMYLYKFSPQIWTWIKVSSGAIYTLQEHKKWCDRDVVSKMLEYNKYCKNKLSGFISKWISRRKMREKGPIN